MVVDYFLGNIRRKDIVYSDTEEVEIGKYIDDKPIYQKVITSASDIAGLDLSSLNIDKLINLKGMINDSKNSYYVPFDYYNSETYRIDYWYDYSTKSINGLYVISGTLSKIYLILQYTKTTD